MGSDTTRNTDRTVNVRRYSDEAYAQLVAIFGGGGGAGGGGTVDVSDRAGRLLGVISGEVSLSLATLADLNDIGVAISNWPIDFPDADVLVKMEEVRVLLAATLSVNADATNRYVGGKTPVCATVTSSGDTDIYTPAAGMAVTLWWVTFITDPDEATTPLVKVLIGALECYRCFALAHWEPFTGAADEPLTINLSAVGSVAVTAHVTEAAP